MVMLLLFFATWLDQLVCIRAVFCSCSVFTLCSEFLVCQQKNTSHLLTEPNNDWKKQKKNIIFLWHSYWFSCSNMDHQLSASHTCDPVQCTDMNISAFLAKIHFPSINLCIYMLCSYWACLWVSLCCTKARAAIRIILHGTSVV